MSGLSLENINDIDALSKMLKLTYSNDDWHPMITIADRLYEESYEIYCRQEKQITTRLYPSERPLIYYFGYSQLCKGVALQKLGRYQESRECIQRYRDLSWIKGVADKDKYIIEDFNIFSIGNLFTLDLMEGREEVLLDYIKFLREHKGQLLAGMITVFEAAIKYDFSIDWVLDELASDLEQIRNHLDDPTIIRNYTEYLYLFSLYEYKQKNYSNAIQKNLDALTVSDNIRDNTAFKKIVALFESFRDYASEEQGQNFKIHLKTILEGVLKDEKDFSFDVIHSGYHQ